MLKFYIFQKILYRIFVIADLELLKINHAFYNLLGFLYFLDNCNCLFNKKNCPKFWILRILFLDLDL